MDPSSVAYKICFILLRTDMVEWPRPTVLVTDRRYHEILIRGGDGIPVSETGGSPDGNPAGERSGPPTDPQGQRQGTLPRAQVGVIRTDGGTRRAGVVARLPSVSSVGMWYRKHGLAGVIGRAGSFLAGTIVLGVVCDRGEDCILDSADLIAWCGPDAVWTLEERWTDGETTQGSLRETVPESEDTRGEPASGRRDGRDTGLPSSGPFVAELRDPLVAGPHATVITTDGSVLTDSVTDDRAQTRWMFDAAILNAPRPVTRALRRGSGSVDVSRLPASALLYHHSDNFYHWVVEQLLKCRAIRHYESMTGTAVDLLVRSNPPPFVPAFLDLCGYDESDIREWDGDPRRVDRLVVPSRPVPTPTTLSWLDGLLASTVGRADDGPTWLYLSRDHAEKGRRVRNLDELKPLFEQYDVETVRPEETSLRAEIATIRQATGIIGPHGAGLTSMLWNTDLAVVEIFNDVRDDTYEELSRRGNYTYEAVEGRPVGSANRAFNRDIEVDIADLEAAIRRTSGSVTE